MSSVNVNNPKTSHVKVKVGSMGIDAALRLFKKKVKEAGILEEYKTRTEYMKPSLRRRAKRDAARKRSRLESQSDE